MYTTKSKQILADLVTPVGLFLKLRDYYPEILLLESTDYSSQAESKSFLCFDSLATLTYNSEHVFWINNHTKETHDLSHLSPVESIEWIHKNLNFNSETAYDQYNGLFGFTSFDAVQYFENISFRSEKTNEYIPLLRYDLYRFIIVFDHYFDTLICIENVPDGEKGQIDHILDIFNKQDIQV